MPAAAPLQQQASDNFASFSPGPTDISFSDGFANFGASEPEAACDFAAFGDSNQAAVGTGSNAFDAFGGDKPVEVPGSSFDGFGGSGGEPAMVDSNAFSAFADTPAAPSIDSFNAPATSQESNAFSAFPVSAEPVNEFGGFGSNNTFQPRPDVVSVPDSSADDAFGTFDQFSNDAPNDTRGSFSAFANDSSGPSLASTWDVAPANLAAVRAPSMTSTPAVDNAFTDFPTTVATQNEPPSVRKSSVFSLFEDVSVSEATPTPAAAAPRVSVAMGQHQSNVTPSLAGGGLFDAVGAAPFEQNVFDTADKAVQVKSPDFLGAYNEPPTTLAAAAVAPAAAPLVRKKSSVGDVLSLFDTQPAPGSGPLSSNDPRRFDAMNELAETTSVYHAGNPNTGHPNRNGSVMMHPHNRRGSAMGMVGHMPPSNNNAVGHNDNMFMGENPHMQHMRSTNERPPVRHFMNSTNMNNSGGASQPPYNAGTINNNNKSGGDPFSMNLF